MCPPVNKLGFSEGEGQDTNMGEQAVWKRRGGE